MRKNGFIKKSLLFLCSISLIQGSVGYSYVYANNDTIYGGAASLVKDAVDLINEGAPKSINIMNNSQDEESVIPKDLSGTFLKGVSIGSVDLSGKSFEEAKEAINKYVDSVSNVKIFFNATEGHSTSFTAGELGISWDDEDTLEDALLLGRGGNLVARYKEKKDLEYNKKEYPLNLNFDRDRITEIVEEQGALYNVEAVDATLSKADGDFTITPGVMGQKISVGSSVSKIMSTLNSFNGSSVAIDLKIVEDAPRGTTEELEMVHDLLGSYKTSFSSSSSDRSGNVRNGTNLVDGTVLYPGEMFSMYQTVSPFTEENGYFLAGSYSNGMVVESFGGGICQVSSTLYNAVLRAELEVNERYNHSMIVTYVDLSSDAAISGTSKDFKFTNSTEHPIYIEAYTTSEKQVVFNIYGVESRPSNRQVSFESVETSKTVPETEKIITDSSMPLGSITVQSAHTGYTGELWKVVTVDGKEVERTQVNKSTYHPSPKTATVGTATDNYTALAIVQAAAASGSIDYVKSVINGLNSAAAAAAQ